MPPTDDGYLERKLANGFEGDGVFDSFKTGGLIRI
jgi:hypothetical protein